MPDSSRLDILIPAYNEGETIIAVLSSFEQHVKSPIRVLICYDHDGDSTLKAIDEREEKFPFPIEYVKNEAVGLHGAVTTGFAKSQADAVLIFPADDLHNAGIIDRMFALFKQGADIVVPSRFVKGGSMHGCTLLKMILTRVSSFTLYHFARLPVHDATNGFRLFSRRVIKEIPIESKLGLALSIELLVKCHRLGWPVVELPSTWIQRLVGISRFRVLRWIPSYLKWYVYAFETTYLRKKIIASDSRARPMAL